jgi:hypothetical protein
MFKIDTIVSIRPILESFHYTQSPFVSLEPILKKLQSSKATGMVKKIDPEKHAIGVLFPRRSDILWFKTYELQRSR